MNGPAGTRHREEVIGMTNLVEVVYDDNGNPIMLVMYPPANDDD